MAEVKVVHPDQLELEAVSGAMKRWSGVSETLTKAEGLHMGMSTIPAGCASSPHHHTNCESAIYVIQGREKMLVGNQLDNELEFGPGDFIYVPPFAPHQPVNPNPPKDTDGRREGSGRGWVRELQGRWPGVLG